MLHTTLSTKISYVYNKHKQTLCSIVSALPINLSNKKSIYTYLYTLDLKLRGIIHNKYNLI